MICKPPLLGLLLFSLLAFLVPVKQSIGANLPSPPHSDVWGYDLSEYPAIQSDRGGTSVYRMPDGDIWFIIDFSFKIENPLDIRTKKYVEEEYILLKFFSGERQQLNKKQREALFDKLGIHLIGNETIHFKDGSILKKEYGHTGKLCHTPEMIYNWYEKITPNGRRQKYSILVGSAQVRVYSDYGCCEAKGAPFSYEILRPVSQIIDLGDDTFIARSDNLIIRFDKNLHTHFIPVTPIKENGSILIPRNFFVIDYSVIEKLQEKFIAANDLPVYQSVHDALLTELGKQYSVTD